MCNEESIEAAQTKRLVEIMDGAPPETGDLALIVKYMVGLGNIVEDLIDTLSEDEDPRSMGWVGDDGLP